MARQVRTSVGFVTVIALVCGLTWVADRLGAEDDIPRFLRQAGQAGRPKAPTTAEPPASQAPPAGQRLREGVTLSNVAGTFEESGDRIAFHPEDGKGPYLVLENLMLERVERIRDEAGSREWIVNGVLTEYGGHNYLLLQRAIVAAEPMAAEPAATEPAESGRPATSPGAERS